MEDMRERMSRVGDSLVHRFGAETLVIEPWGSDGLRVRATIGREVLDTNWALSETVETRSDELSIDIEPTQATIRNGRISARVHDGLLQRGRVQFFRHEGDTAVPILQEFDYPVPGHNPGTRVFSEPVDGLARTEAHFAAPEGERLYGMGLNATGRVDLKGTVIDLYQRHVKHTVPFLVSTERYGFLWNNPSLGRAEFGADRTRWVSDGCRQIDYYVTTADTYAGIMANYADVTGHAPDFPEWAAGFWMCKARYETQADFLEAAREFRRRNLPVSVLTIDYLHWKRMGDWDFDPEFWPDPQSMIDEMTELGIRTMISPWIMVDPASDNFAPMEKLGLFTGSVDGRHDEVEGWGMPGEPYRQYDPTNPEAARYLWAAWKKSYFDRGISTFWLDPCDDFHAIRDYPLVTFHAGIGTEVHNYFPVAHQKNIHDGLLAAGENEIVMITRSSWAGSQRYGAAPAAHDILSTFESLEAYMKAGLNLAMSGIPWGASEIGGFFTLEDGELTATPTSDYFRELLVRWYQYGVFTPVFRTHGDRNNNEPWAHGDDVYQHIRDAILLRERLRPYVMEQMALASSAGIPPMRPVFFDHSDDPLSFAIEDQFKFGPDLLVAPITSFNARSRDVYLPAGHSWIDARTGARHTGGQTLNVDAPLEHTPAFVREGASVLSVFVTQGDETRIEHV